MKEKKSSYFTATWKMLAAVIIGGIAGGMSVVIYELMKKGIDAGIRTINGTIQQYIFPALIIIAVVTVVVGEYSLYRLKNVYKEMKDADEEVENEVAPILHIKRTVRETGRDYNDKSEIIYINARMKENTDLGRLMHDFHCTKAEDMYSKVLAERVRVLKETQEGVEIMCKEMDKIYKAGELIGEERGKEKGKYETAMKLLELGAREDMIAEVVGHSVEEIKRWKNDMKH